ncbi:LacI family DNA-binding transcriptional regulator [Rothia kristinae]|uniref:LacI family DNA-binding transcriptional regulator n=1 Tax=Rothia kristinae TaxID=37923 RepID=UPI000C269ECA
MTVPQPKLADVAAAAGVSPTTVSRVLNDRGYLSQKTKDAVHAAMAELGYRPNAIARSLQQRSSRLVGIIFPTVAHPFYGQMAEALETRLAGAGYKVLLCDSAGRPDRERRHLDMLLANQVDGIITGAHSQVVGDYPGLRAPVVTIDRPKGHDFPDISCDNRTVMRELTRGVIARGARRILHLTSSRDPQAPRLLGHAEAMAEAGLEPAVLRPEPSRGWWPDPEQIDPVLDRAWEAAAAPGAVMCSNDLLAAAVLSWARRRGLRVPRDLQVTGFDGSAASRIFCPELSTVVQPYGAMAREAVAAILAAVDGEPLPAGTRELPATIDWRETTRPA